MRTFVLFILIIIAQAVFSQEAEKTFEQANQLYGKGEYEKATESYEQIVFNGYEHPSLYYNLGNVYYKQKKYPEAILNFERARRLDPNDEDIAHNLSLANLHVVDKIEPVPQLFLIEWWMAFVNLYSTDGWALASILALWGTMVLGSALLLLRSDILRRLILLGAALGLMLSIISVIGLFQQHRVEKLEYAIIFAPSVSVKSAPDAQSTDLFVIHEGVKALVMDVVGDWKKIKLADGKVGWMLANGLQTI